MLKKLFILLVPLFITQGLYGQLFRVVAGEGKKASDLVYIEVLGVGGYGSVNYERIVVNRDIIKIGLRGGFGTYKLYDYRERFNPDMILPFSLNLLIFSPHTIELGIGNTYSSIVRVNTDNLKPERVRRMSASLNIGYRYSKKEGGLILRVGYTPVLEFYKRYIHGGGISIGYAF